MRISVVWVLLSLLCPPAWGADRCRERDTHALLVHGGAGARKGSEEARAKKVEILAEAVRKGHKLLKKGDTAVTAVETVIRILEDSPLFNAGRGGIPNQAGFVELDASIMDGATKQAGAVAATRTVKNPISAARAAMERSEHLLFVGEGADAFAKSKGIEAADPDYFLEGSPYLKADPPKESGTVGAVALDRCGNLAAGTSTGGFSAKTPGRVGDSPIIGAGTYADNDCCAVSCTGHGEFFIRYVAAFHLVALRTYGGRTLEEAGKEVIFGKLKAAGGEGGLIGLDREGRMTWPYSSAEMLRAYARADGTVHAGYGPELKALR